MQLVVIAQQQARVRAIERRRELDIEAHKHWEKLVSDYPEDMTGATYLCVEPTKSDYGLKDHFVMSYMTKYGDTKSIVLRWD